MSHRHLTAGSIALVLALAASSITGRCAAAQQQVQSQVRVTGGEIQGIPGDRVIAFKGIPFAAPPVGDLRWRAPQPVMSWSGVRSGAEYGSDCMQRAFPGAPQTRAPSEDCLFLNVWRPSTPAAAKLPVMVWIHGGGFVAGSSSSPGEAGTEFAKSGVVLVNLNYRLGRFGFFAHPGMTSEHQGEDKYNYAYLDQIAALKWVQENISAFGGDPKNVTVFGFSAGGVSVHSLIASPGARGLFQKAIVHSGGSRDGVLTARPLRGDGVDKNYPISAETIGLNFAQSLGIKDIGATALAKLRGLTAQQVLDGAPVPASTASSPQAARPPETVPILDGRVVTETAEAAYKAGRQPSIPLMLGSNSGDTAGRRIRATTKDQLFARFSPWEKEARSAYDPNGDVEFATLLARAEDDFGQSEGARFAANAFAKNGSPVYLFRFGYVPPAQRPRLPNGSPHGGDLPYVFGTLDARWGNPAITATDQSVSRMMHSYWVNFAKTGNPNGKGLPRWPSRRARQDQIFQVDLDGTGKSASDPRKARLDVTEKATEAGKRSDF